MRSASARRDGSRGLISLAILTVVSGLVGYFLMRTQPYRGADFVVLTMAVGILFAFAVAVLNWIIGKITGLRFLSPHGAASHLRDGAAAVPDLPGARHDLHRRRDADRRRRDGRVRGHPSRDLQALARPQPQPLQLAHAEVGHRGDGQALGFRRVHPGRRAHFLAHVLWRERARLGGASADVAARRADRLPYLHQHPRVPARFLPRFLRDRVHHHPAAWCRPRRKSASI